MNDYSVFIESTLQMSILSKVVLTEVSLIIYHQTMSNLNKKAFLY